MAWTAPRTWTTGEIITATLLNTHLRDNLEDLDRRTTTSGAVVATSQTTTSTSMTDLATVGPAVTVTIGSTGKALVAIFANLANNTAGSAALMSWAVSGATTVAASDDLALLQRSPSGSADIQAGATFLQSSLNSGSTTFTAKYRVDGNTGTFLRRRILVTPLGS